MRWDGLAYISIPDGRMAYISGNENPIVFNIIIIITIIKIM